MISGSQSVSEKGFLQDVRHNSGKIYRKVGRIDCGNAFSNTL